MVSNGLGLCARSGINLPCQQRRIFEALFGSRNLIPFVRFRTLGVLCVNTHEDPIYCSRCHFPEPYTQDLMIVAIEVGTEISINADI